MFRIMIKTSRKFLLVGLLPLLLSCSSSTDPQPDGVEVTFLPATSDFQVTQGDTVNFQVSRAPSGVMDVRWTVGGTYASSNPDFSYISLTTGLTEIAVSATADGQNYNSSWSLLTESFGAHLPPVVFNFNANHGNEIGEVLLSWPRMVPTEHPITHYLLAFSTMGPITVDNWSEAEALGTVNENSGIDLHVESFDGEDGIPEGQVVWFAVVAVDELGNQSLRPTMASITPTYAWYIDGVIYNDSHEPLHAVIVDFGCNTCRVTTNQDGIFRGGPFSSRDNISLYTVTGDIPGADSAAYYDVSINDIAPAENVEVEIALIERYGSDIGCGVYEGDFLNLFMDITKTDFATPGRDNRFLYKWDHYPVSVYIPDYINDYGLDMASLCRAGLELWNVIMEEDYFVLVDDLESAKIYFDFPHLTMGHGLATMMEPNSVIGDTIPELVEILIDNTNHSVQWIQEIAMHELGHALGCADHIPSACNSLGYLMFVDPGGVLSGDELDAIHSDERNMIRAIRYLPMAYDLSRVEHSRNPN